MINNIAAIHYQSDTLHDNALQLLNDLVKYKTFGQIVVFYSSDIDDDLCRNENNIASTCIAFPEDCDNVPKQKNFILNWASSQAFQGFLHIIEDNVVLDKDPTTYVSSLQNAMDVLDYDIYFSTVTDPCNYMFRKFSPRISVQMDIDDIQAKLKLPKTLSFTSHSNIAWTVYNYGKLVEVPQYDERFSIGMFFIIEYLARRRATKRENQLYFMNQYLSISDEIGTFFTCPMPNDAKLDPKTMQDEDAIFKGMNIDYAPDNNIDVVLDALYAKLKEKMN